MKLDQVYQLLGQPATQIVGEDGVSVLLYRPTSSELDDVQIRAKGAVVSEIYGNRLECNDSRLSPDERAFSKMHSKTTKLLEKHLGPPEKVLETEELGAEFWLYPSFKLQILLSPGKAPWYYLKEEFQVPAFALSQSELDEFEYNLKAGLELDWQPNPRADVAPYED